MSQRGRGKVITRQKKDSLPGSLSNSVAAVDSSGSSSSATSAEHSSKSPVAATSSTAITPAASSASSKPCTPASDSSACRQLRSSSSSTSSAWRCAAYLQAGHVTELQHQLLGTAKSRQLLAAHEPVLLRSSQLATCQLASNVSSRKIGAPAAAAAAAAAVPPDSAAPGARQQGEVEVLCSPADVNRFIAADLRKNAPGSYYHLRKPETRRLAMNFSDWLGAWQCWTHSRLLLQVHVCQWELRTPEAAASSRAAAPKVQLRPNQAIWPHLPQLLRPSSSSSSGSSSCSGAGSAAGSAAAALLDWPLLQQLLHDGQYQAQGGLQLLAGGRDALLPAKYETHDRLMCQVSGRQLLLLVPPEQGFRGCYPFPVAHPYDGYSCVDWEEPELSHWPAAAAVRGATCELAPGDSLLIPAYWFVHSQLQQPACVALSCSLEPQPAKLQMPGALLMQLSRMAELWLAAEAGAANVRQWLLALSESREWQLLEKQLATVKGCKLLRACHMVLRHTQAVLRLLPPSSEGPEAASISLECRARQLLAAMCDERLMPTHWLNEGITDPLYLKHQPQHYLIQEDAEAARYAALFSHRLIQNKPDWQQHAQQLQLLAPQEKKMLQLQQR